MTTEQDLRPILLVEDEASDVELLCRAFEKAKILNRIIHLSSGDQALAYLNGSDEYGDRKIYPLPSLILLDLKLPGMTGLQLLQWKRAQDQLRRIPVVVLTGDNDPDTIGHAYDAGANSYLVKPGTQAEVLRMAKAIDQYWTQLNEPPQLAFRAEP
jgi:CheY-like chemotaxis protein